MSQFFEARVAMSNQFSSAKDPVDNLSTFRLNKRTWLFKLNEGSLHSDEPARLLAAVKLRVTGLSPTT